MYECHITVRVADAVKADQVALEDGWKTSEIKRDPVLGDDSHYYLTKHGDRFSTIFIAMEKAVMKLENYGITVLRKKIEHIVYDSKTGVGLRFDRAEPSCGHQPPTQSGHMP